MIRIFLALFVLLLTACTQSPTPIITDFESCAQAGFPVMESYPRQCRTNSGDLYIEQISGTDPEQIFCTMDAQTCPDGSSVGRIPPNCDFAPCPGSDSNQPFTASFQITTHGTRRTFDQPMYHYQSETAFITAANPSQITITKPTTWNDFFSTLPFTLTRTCLITGTNQTFCTNERNKLTFTLNGQLTDQALDQLINPGDHLSIEYK